MVETAADSRPRWSFTPSLMQAPFSLSRPKDPRRSVWASNEDPAVLDRFYERFLGPQWPGMLPDELKWLAVTHKSFDQGRRGFNDRLAYLGAFCPCFLFPLVLFIILEVEESCLLPREIGKELGGSFDQKYGY
ncbi:MAG: hypothetical protein IMZ46_17765 [Acidobacteria bacterium]|nr:hypothetical protein [Acidobacteriota bacterium]